MWKIADLKYVGKVRLVNRAAGAFSLLYLQTQSYLMDNNNNNNVFLMC